MGALILALTFLVVYKLGDRYAARRQAEFYDSEIGGGGAFMVAVLVQAFSLFLALVALTMFIGGILHAYFG